MSAMARPLRMEAESGVYHVLNRGNYRTDIFRSDKAKLAFLKCLGEACAKTGWVVHAWCLMSNHYHLAVTTPGANLVDGMRWLQGTFSTRFNRMRNERATSFRAVTRASSWILTVDWVRFATTSTSIPSGRSCAPSRTWRVTPGPAWAGCWSRRAGPTGINPNPPWSTRGNWPTLPPNGGATSIISPGSPRMNLPASNSTSRDVPGLDHRDNRLHRHYDSRRARNSWPAPPGGWATRAAGP